MKFYHALLILCTPVALFGVDSDGDGVLDQMEIIEGTDPNDSSSLLEHSRNLYLFSIYNERFGVISNDDSVDPSSMEGQYEITSKDEGFFIYNTSESYLRLEANDLPTGTELSISVWVDQVSAQGSYEGYISFPDATQINSWGSHLGIETSSSGLMIWRRGPPPYDMWSDFSLSLGIHHIVCTIKDGQGRIYVDGDLIKNGTSNGTVSADGGGISLLYRTGRSMKKAGLSNLRIYSRQLSDSEVKSLHNLGVLKESPSPSIPIVTTPQGLYEPKIGDMLTLDATATSGYPAPTYQWYYEGFPISSVVGGNQPVLSIPVTLNPSVEGVYRCVVSNSEGTVEVETRVVLFRDDDNDGLSNYQETNTHLTDPQDSDSDDDGLTDGVEINDHLTNPNDADSDDDGFSDYDEVTVYQSDPLVLNVAWGRYIVGTDKWINTQDWLGWLKVEEGGWLWSVNERSYIWVPESSAEAGSGWVYHP